MDNLIVVSYGDSYRVYLSSAPSDYAERETFFDAFKAFVLEHKERFGIGDIMVSSQPNTPPNNTRLVKLDPSFVEAHVA